MSEESKRGGNDHPWHDERGRFKPGNPGGPGRPKGWSEAKAIARHGTLQDVLSDAAWERICKQQVDKAEQGDERAVEWLSRHILITPEKMARLELDREQAEAKRPPEEGTVFEGVVVVEPEDEEGGK